MARFISFFSSHCKNLAKNSFIVFLLLSLIIPGTFALIPLSASADVNCETNPSDPGCGGGTAPAGTQTISNTGAGSADANTNNPNSSSDANAKNGSGTNSIGSSAASGAAGFSSCLIKYALGAIFTATDKVTAIAAVPVDVQNSATKIAQTGNQTANFWKDCIEHALALWIGRMILDQMTQAIVKWIDGGFDGQPAFLTNPSQFFSKIGDDVFSQFIKSTDLAFLCDPFKVQVKLALQFNYSSTFSSQNSCTLSQVTKNISGAFSSFDNGGGWPGFMSISQNTQNNAYGSFLQSSGQLESRINGTKSIQLSQLNWGNGFLSWQTCKDGTVLYNGVNTGNRTDCVVRTPGKVISDQLTGTIAEPLQQIGLADDLDKIMNALTDQLFKSIFTSPTGGGLLGSNGGAANTARNKPASDLANSYASTANSALSSDSNAFNQTNQDAQDTVDAAGSTTTQPVNIAAKGVSSQSGITPEGCGAEAALTGSKSGLLVRPDNTTCLGVSLVGPDQSNYAWWYDDLKTDQKIGTVIVYPRSNPSYADLGTGGKSPRVTTFQVVISSVPPPSDPALVPTSGTYPGQIWVSPVENMDHATTITVPVTTDPTNPILGRYVWIVDTTANQWLELGHVEIFNLPAPKPVDSSGAIVYPGEGDTSSTGSAGSTYAGGPVGAQSTGVTSGPTTGTVVNVDKTNWQTKINSAAPGSTIAFAAGTYPVTIQTNLPGNLTYVGQFGQTTFKGDSSDNAMLILRGVNNVDMSGFTFDQVTLNIGNGGSNLNIHDNKFQNLTRQNAIYVDSVTQSNFNHNTFTNLAGGGIYGYPNNSTNDTYDGNKFDYVFEPIHLIANSPGPTDVSFNVISHATRIAIEMQNAQNNLTTDNNYFSDWLQQHNTPGDNQDSHMALSLATGGANTVTAAGNVMIQNGPAQNVNVWAKSAIEVMGTNITVANNYAWNWGNGVLNGANANLKLNNNVIIGGAEWSGDAVGWQPATPTITGDQVYKLGDTNAPPFPTSASATRGTAAF